jgi:hypothetical protein
MLVSLISMRLRPRSRQLGHALALDDKLRELVVEPFCSPK